MWTADFSEVLSDQLYRLILPLFLMKHQAPFHALRR